MKAKGPVTGRKSSKDELRQIWPHLMSLGHVYQDDGYGEMVRANRESDDSVARFIHGKTGTMGFTEH